MKNVRNEVFTNFFLPLYNYFKVQTKMLNGF